MPLAPIDIPDATLRLALARGLGPATVRRLRKSFGSDEAIVEAPARAMRRVRGISRRSADALVEAIRAADPAAERDRMQSAGAAMIRASDDDYPPLLGLIADAPPFLWVRGHLHLDDRRALAVVGSRRCTPYGREQAARFAGALGRAGLTIVSGGAVGIDAAAHRGALAAPARTIVVLGCGLGQCYPAAHQRLFEEVVAGGCAIVSELPTDAPPLARHFPRRNRIISGLGLGVLLVEAAPRGGALITARLAADDHGREVMAVPGRVDSPSAAGALQAIRDGWAGLVIEPADVLRQLQSARSLILATGGSASGLDERIPEAPLPRTIARSTLTPAQLQVAQALDGAGTSIIADELIGRTGLPVSEVSRALTMLELAGIARREGGGYSLAPDVRFT